MRIIDYYTSYCRIQFFNFVIFYFFSDLEKKRYSRIFFFELETLVLIYDNFTVILNFSLQLFFMYISYVISVLTLINPLKLSQFFPFISRPTSLSTTLLVYQIFTLCFFCALLFRLMLRT